MAVKTQVPLSQFKNCGLQGQSTVVRECHLCAFSSSCSPFCSYVLPKPGLKPKLKLQRNPKSVPARSSAAPSSSCSRNGPSRAGIRSAARSTLPSRSGLKPAAEKCDHKGWMSMKDDVRDTVVSGGVVLYGEAHDNPLHHELRSRLGLSNYGSSVFEQISADAAPGLEAYLKDNGAQIRRYVACQVQGRGKVGRRAAGRNTNMTSCCCRRCAPKSRSSPATPAVRR